jgi:hypothetical protein
MMRMRSVRRVERRLQRWSRRAEIASKIVQGVKREDSVE